MEIRNDRQIIPLGYGKYIRADKIISLEPIEEKRGPGRRTMVYAEGVNGPIIASRTEGTILRDIVEIPMEVLDAEAAFLLLHDILDDLRDVGPMLRRSIRQEGGLDIDRLERRIEQFFEELGSQEEDSDL